MRNPTAELAAIYKKYPFMAPQVEQEHETENYVAVPPALIITDAQNNVWTLGFQTAPQGRSPDGEFAFNVLKNGMETGEVASRIERRSSRIRIFTCDGWKRWTGSSFI